MQTSAEIRWFWRDAPPDGLRAWFLDPGVHGVPAGGAETRVDGYLAEPGQRELGIKQRGGADGAVEIKGLVSAAFGVVAVAAFEAPLELWSKWSSRALPREGVRRIDTSKRRWLRKFVARSGGATEIPLDDGGGVAKGEAPDAGCNVELTEVSVGAEIWWTFGFEAFGTLDGLEREVCAAATTLEQRGLPSLRDGWRGGYPAWLAERVMGG